MSATLLALGADAKAALAGLAMMALQGSLLALLAYALVRAGKLRFRTQAAIWLVVLVKFVLPWGPALPWSLADVIAALRGTHEAAVAAPVPLAIDGPPIATPSVAAAAGWLALAALWAAGSLVYLTRALVASRAATRAARRAPRAPDHSRAVLARLAGPGVRPPALVLGAADTGPHVVGIFRPIIVIPPALVGDTALLRAVLLHELAHVRRRDALARIAQLAAMSLFFFWPLARLAARRLDHAREAACDAWAIETGALARPTYARLLVTMATLHRAPAGAAAMASATAAKLDARVQAILAAAPHRRLGPIAALGLVAWVALALGGARAASARPEPVCHYSSALATAMYVAHPEADLDGDGTLSRAEACDLQVELRKRATEAPSAPNSSRLPDAAFVEEPLCCNSESIQGQPPLANDQTCHSEGPTQ